MISDREPEPTCGGGDPPCWSHLFEDIPDDIADGDEIDAVVGKSEPSAA